MDAVSLLHCNGVLEFLCQHLGLCCCLVHLDLRGRNKFLLPFGPSGQLAMAVDSFFSIATLAFISFSALRLALSFVLDAAEEALLGMFVCMGRGAGGLKIA